MSNVTFSVLARDEASATFNRVGNSVESLHSKLTRLVKGLGLATLGYEAVQFGRKAVDAFAVAETGQNRLVDAYARFPRLADVNRTALLSLNQAITAKTGADRDQLAAAEANLAGFKLTGDQIKQLIPLVNDYATRTGQDLPTAATALGRAFLGNTRALKTIGIEFKATGNTAADFTTIMGLLRSKVGGLADREAKTAAGQLKILREQFREVEVSVGSALLPALVHLGHFLEHDVVPPLQNTAHWLKENKSWVEPLAKSLVVGAAAWKAYVFAAKGAEAIKGLSIGRAATASLATTAVGAAKPIPVWVVNFKGGGFLPVGGGAPAAATEAELATEGGVIGAAMAAKLGRGARIASLGLQAAKYAPLAFVGAQSDLKDPSSFALDSTSIRNLTASVAKMKAELQSGSGKFADPKMQEALRGQINYTAAVLKTNGVKIAGVPATNKLATAEAHLTAVTDKGTSSLKDQLKTLGKSQDRALALSSAQDSLRTAIHGMAVAAGAGGKALVGNSDGALANRDAIRGAVQQAEAYVQVMKDQHAGQQKVAATTLALSNAILTNASATFGNREEVAALLKTLGFLPRQIRAAFAGTGSEAFLIGENIMANLAAGIDVSSSVVINHAAYVAGQTSKEMRLAAGLDAGVGNSGNQVIPLKQVKAAKDAGAAIAQSVTSGYSPVVDKGLTKATNQALSNLRQRLKTDLSAFKQAITSETDSLAASFGALSLATRSGPFGTTLPALPFQQQLAREAAKFGTFVHLIGRLRHEGLGQRLIDQLEALGPEAIPAMRQLLGTGRKGIRRDNALDRQIVRDARSLASADTLSKDGQTLHHDLQLVRQETAHLRREVAGLVRDIDAALSGAQHRARSGSGQ